MALLEAQLAGDMPQMPQPVGDNRRAESPDRRDRRYRSRSPAKDRDRRRRRSCSREDSRDDRRRHEHRHRSRSRSPTHGDRHHRRSRSREDRRRPSRWDSDRDRSGRSRRSRSPPARGGGGGGGGSGYARTAPPSAPELYKVNSSVSLFAKSVLFVSSKFCLLVGKYLEVVIVYQGRIPCGSLDAREPVKKIDHSTVQYERRSIRHSIQ